MRAASRALGALALAGTLALSAVPASALPGEDPSPATASTTLTVPTPSGGTAQIQVNPVSGTVAAPPIAADSWVLADLDSGQVLASQNADLPVRPASTQKLLTALTVAPRLSPNQPYRAVEADEQAIGNRVVMYEGLRYTVADLLHAALLPSANDAAEALARANGGLDVTIAQMNEEAARLGATGTTARNPSGLDEEGQVTTAHDMALIGRAAFTNPEIADYLQLRLVDFPGKMEGGRRVIYPIYNHNQLLSDTTFEGALGKSGYTSKAGRTFVAAAEREGRRLLVTLFRIGGNTYRSGAALLDWGFDNAASLAPIGQLEDPSAPAPVFDRALQPLPGEGQAVAPRRPATPAPVTNDAPTAPERGDGWSLRSLSLPGVSGLPSALTVLTLLMAVVVLLRARVYWNVHRNGRARRPLTAASAARDHGPRRASAPRPPSTPHAPAPRYRVPGAEHPRTSAQSVATPARAADADLVTTRR